MGKDGKGVNEVELSIGIVQRRLQSIDPKRGEREIRPAPSDELRALVGTEKLGSCLGS